MQTFKRLCVEDYAVDDKNGDRFELERGKEYFTSRVTADGEVNVYSTFWVSVPLRLFANAVEFTPATSRCATCGQILQGSYPFVAL